MGSPTSIFLLKPGLTPAGSDFMKQVDEEGRRIREAIARRPVRKEHVMTYDPAGYESPHLTALKYPEHPRGIQLVAKLDALPEDEIIGLSIVTVEEQMRGWLAAIAKERQSHRQVRAYRELERLFQYFQFFQIAAFDERSADEFDKLRADKLRIGTMDLKIAATALVHDALLLSANMRDFARVPGLKVENWID